jgi:hypothetical protein
VLPGGSRPASLSSWPFALLIALLIGLVAGGIAYTLGVSPSVVSPVGVLVFVLLRNAMRRR